MATAILATVPPLQVKGSREHCPSILIEIEIRHTNRRRSSRINPCENHFAEADLIAKKLSCDDDGLGVMQESVQDGRGDGAIIVEDRGSMLVGLVGCQNDAIPLLALTHHLDEQVDTVLVDE